MIIMLIGMNLISLGNQVIAVNLTSQNSKTNNQNVEFDSYFEGNNYTKNFNIEQEATLYISLKVKNSGYLKDGIVRISDANYEIVTEKLKSEKVQNDLGGRDSIQPQYSVYLQVLHFLRAGVY